MDVKLLSYYDLCVLLLNEVIDAQELETSKSSLELHVHCSFTDVECLCRPCYKDNKRH